MTTFPSSPSSKHLYTWPTDNSLNTCPLTKAILEGNSELSLDLISQGADVHVTDNEGRTALMSAAYEGNKEICELLIDAGANVHQRDKYKHTPLFYSIAHDREEVARLLVEKGADINACDKHRKTPLFFAVENDNVEVAGMLIEGGADLNAFDKHRKTPLFYAAEKNNDKVAKLLIDKGADLHVLDKSGKTPLLFAAKHSNELFVRLLLGNNADMNQSDSYGETPFFSAARNNDEKVVRLMIEKGAGVNVSNKYGQTPLFLASLNTNEDVAKLLIEKGADVNASDKYGVTPLLFAAQHSNEQVARLLIEKGANVQTCVNNDGQTPLIVAARYTNRAFARLLIEKGADVNASDKYGESALLSAAGNTNEQVARLMIEKGAIVRPSNRHGKSPLFVAAKNPNKEVALLLIEKGADVNPSDKYEESALLSAAGNTNEQVARLLIEKGAIVRPSNRHGKSTPLFVAAKNPNKEVALLLIEKGADVNAIEYENGETPLFAAAENINEEVPRLLIEKGANINASMYNLQTPLFFATGNTNKEITQMLIEEGADVNDTDICGQTPLFLAAKNTNEEVARLLIENGADVNVWNDVDGKTPLCLAVENTNENVARLLIEKGADVNVCSIHGHTLLFIAAENTNKEVARLLIEKGADVNASAVDGRTPLFFAAKNKNEDVARLLIEKGANVNQCDKNGQTAIFSAAKSDNEEVMLLLIEKGAVVNGSDKDGKTAFYTALQYDNHDVAYLLLKSYHADMHTPDKHGRTALFHLCGLVDYHPPATSKYYDIPMDQLIREVISACNNIDEKDDKGRTALSYSIDAMNTSERYESMAQALIDAGTDVNIADDMEQTPLFYAFTASAVRLLYKHRADFDVRNNDQETVLIHAVKNIECVYLKSDFFATLLSCVKQEVDARDIHGRTAMLYAVTSCKTIKKFKAVARALIDNGADLNVTDNNDVSVVAYFIEAYADYSVGEEIDDNGDRYLYIESLEVVMKGGLDFFTENGIKDSTLARSALSFLYVQLPLYYFRGMGSLLNEEPDLFSIARKYGCDRELKCIENLKALLHKEKVPEALDALMMLGINPNSADSYGNTALHYATLLPFICVSQECARKILQTLEKHRVRFNVKNNNMETPLHFCLSERALILARKNGTWNGIETVVEICKFLLKNGSLISETTRSGESVYHLIMRLFIKGLSMKHEKTREVVCLHTVQLLELFSKTTGKQSFVLNRMDNKCNSPLHLWASLSLPPNQNYEDHITNNLTFQKLLEKILEHLFTPKVTPNPRNEDDQTPLHLSKTWTATKLLLNAGANANDLDRMKRPPLLNFAKHQEFQNNPRCFFPDVEDDAAPFFEKCVSLGLDIWSSDREGQSILGILLDSEAYVLANALIEVVVTKCTCKLIFEEMVNTICKDESTSTTWKSLLTEKLITSSNLPSELNLNDALCHICTNIDKLRHQGQGLTIDEEEIESDGPPNKKPRIDDTGDNTRTKWNVFVDIGRQLLFYGADGNSLCKDFPGLCSFLTIKINPGQMKTIIPWTSHSNTHKEKLEIVSRKQDVEKIGTYCFHKEPIGSGSFGDVYAGICENDAREVAIKKIKKSSVLRPVDEREKRVLIELADCQQVVHYISFDDFNNDFVYIVLELMEGHLDDYLASHSVDEVERVNLCKEIIKGMRYLHQHKPKPILHRDLKPTNILYKFDRNGKLCLKIADFGLSSPPTPTTGRTTVLPTKVATRNWIAPEVTRSQPYQYFQSSDVFCCGLLFHYILSKQKHPFSPADCSNKSIEVIVHETQDNMLKYKMEGWDDEISPEANHLIIDMLQQDHGQRPSAADSLCHPFFWSNKKRMEFLRSVGNQTEFECPSTIKATSHHVTPVETDLNSNSAKIVKYGKWDDLNYKGMANVVAEMNKPIVKVNKKGKTYHNKPRTYDTVSVVELVRFIRNAIAHVSEASRPTNIRKLILDDFVFLKEFPHLLIEVYKAVTTHGWDKREEIKYAISSYGE